ncbi:MAG: CvpA family protein [Oscillospiraceae bacterium]|nr:CvpA family protein [Oscillospiraceae bacterium]
MTVSLIYDVLLLAVLILFFCIYYGKGLIRALLKLLGFLGALLTAAFVSGKVAPMIYTAVVQQPLVNFVADQLAQYRDGMMQAFSEGLIGTIIRSFVSAPEQLFGVDLSQTASNIVSGSLQSVIVAVIRIVVFVLVFIVAQFVIRLIARMTGGFNRLPILGFANRLLGGLLGIVMAVMALLVIGAVMSVMLNFVTTPWFNAQVIEGSYLFSQIFRLNPLYV